MFIGIPIDASEREVARKKLLKILNLKERIS